MEFTDKGREAFARVTKRIAERGRDCETLAGVSPDCPPAQPGRPRELLPALRDHARQPDRLARDDRLPGEPGGHRRPHRRPIENIGTIQRGAGPRREPAHRRAADQPEADLADAGLGHARQAGARPGPHRGGGRPRADDPVPARLLPRARHGRDRGAPDLRGAPVRARQADPDHAHAPGHRGNGAHPGGGGRRQHRHVRANKGGGAGGQIGAGRHLGGLHEGAPDDHRRERRDDRRGLHPVHARHGGRARASRSRSESARSSRCSPPCSPPRRSSARSRARGSCGGRARSAWPRRRARAGSSTSWATRAGSSRSPARSSRRARSRSPRSESTSESTSSPARGSPRRSSRRRAWTRCARRSSRSATATRRSRSVDDPELGKNVVQIEVAQLDPGQVTKVEQALDEDFGVAAADFSANSVGPDLRRADRADRGDRGDRVAAPDLALHRLPLRVEVRGAGADRAGARPADHRGRLRPVRAGGHDRHGRRPADDPRLLALRHGDRVRPNTRERAAHAARDLLPDREPFDVRGVHAIARHELRGADAGRLAAAVRRRDAEGLRVRAAGRRDLRRLLVDLHRHAGAGGVEGARARPTCAGAA